ncbi:MAG TPA: hypothetical protein VG291_18375 [Xanthobacteraceae bacterium]|jgi:hypothetical protein|nr:hypothetical protein [Xanthobacteraceae bacterium]
MPILVWIATIACMMDMMEMAGVLPSARQPSELTVPKKRQDRIDR